MIKGVRAIGQLAPRVVAATLVVACADPVSIRFLTPQLENAIVRFGTNVPGSEFMEFLVAPADSMLQPGPNDRVRVRVEVAGDREDVELARYMCPGLRVCSRLVITMEDGSDPAALAPGLRSIGARLEFITISRRYASAVVFGREAEAVMETVRGWPGVRRVEPDIIASQGVGNALYSVMATALPLEYSASEPGDGILQVQSGDSITLRYEQVREPRTFTWVVP